MADEVVNTEAYSPWARKIEDINPSAFKERPDFSVFDAPVLSWSMNFGSDIDDEDSLSIVFAGVPRYNGQPISKRQVLQINFANLRLLPIVRDVDYALNNNSFQTTLTMCSAKKLFDQYPKVAFSTRNNTVGGVLGELITRLQLRNNISQLSIVTEYEAGFQEIPVDGNIEFTTKDNILDRLNSELKENKIKLVDWWVDLAARINIANPNYSNSRTNPTPIDYNSDARFIINYSINLTDEWRKQEEITTIKENNPRESLLPPVPISNPPSTTEVEATPIPPTNANSSTQTETTLSNKVVDSLKINMVFAGIHTRFEPHTKISLVNFPLKFHPSEVFKIKKIEWNETSSVATTTLSLENEGRATPIYTDESKYIYRQNKVKPAKQPAPAGQI